MRDGKERVSKLKQKKQISVIIATGILLPILYVIFDYNNIPSKLGVDIKKINMSLFGIIMNIAIVVITFALTYYFIEKRRIEKQDNQRWFALYLMKQCYESCLYWIDFIEEYQIPIGDNEHEQNCICDVFSKRPYNEDNLIRQYMMDGTINKMEIDEYMSIKNLYEVYVFMNTMHKLSENRCALIKNELEKQIHSGLDVISKPEEKKEGILSRIKKRIIDCRNSLFSQRQK